MPEVLREAYYPGRPFAPLPEPPVPYETLSETFSYGYRKEAAVCITMKKSNIPMTS